MVDKKYTNNNAKYKLLPMETIERDKYYTFTVNPAGLENADRYSAIMCLAKKLADKADISLNLELSTRMRLHAHGTIKINNIHNIIPIYEILWDAYEHFNIEIDQLKDEKIWREYCNKQKTIMEYYCKRRNWIYHISNISLNKDQILYYFSMGERMIAQLDCFDAPEEKRQRGSRKKNKKITNKK